MLRGKSVLVIEYPNNVAQKDECARFLGIARHNMIGRTEHSDER